MKTKNAKSEKSLLDTKSGERIWTVLHYVCVYVQHDLNQASASCTHDCRIVIAPPRM